MSTAPTPTPPILGCLTRVRGELDAVRDVQPVYMPARDKATALLELARVEAQAAELKLRILAIAEDVAEETGARDAGAWLSHHAHTDRQASRADLALAKAWTGSIHTWQPAWPPVSCRSRRPR